MTEKKKKRVAIYIRVSTLDQAKKGYSIPAQLRSLEAHINNEEENGWIYDKSLIYIDEGESGAKDERPQLNKMKEDILLGKIDVVLVWKIDRLFRKTRYLLEMMEFFKKNQVEFSSKNEKIDTSSSTGRLVLTLLAAIAEMERETFNERSILSKIAKSEDGYYVGGGCPYGYEIRADEKGKKLFINASEAEIVKKIFDMYVRQGKTQAGIAKELTSLGVPVRADSMNGKRKKAENEGVWGASTIGDILGHPHYSGEYYYNRYKWENKKRVGEKPEEDWIPLKCEAILDARVLERATELKKTNQANATKATNNRYILVGKVICGSCGYAYKGYPASKKPHFYYTCNGKYKKANNCKAKQISGDLIESLVWNSIESMVGKPKVFIKYLEDKSDTSRNIKKYSSEIVALNLKKQESETIKNRYYKFLGDEQLDEAEIKAIINQETKKIQQIDKLISEKDELIKNEETKEGLGESIIKLSKIYKNNIKNATREEKYKLISVVIDRILIYDDRVEVYYKFNTKKPKTIEVERKKKALKANANSKNYSGSVIDQ